MPWHLQILLRPVPCLSTSGATQRTKKKDNKKRSGGPPSPRFFVREWSAHCEASFPSLAFLSGMVTDPRLFFCAVAVRT